MPSIIDELRALLVSSLRLQLSTEKIGVDSYLFGHEFGLDSVDAVQLVSAIEERFGVEISDQELAHFKIATLRSIAEMLESKGVRAG